MPVIYYTAQFDSNNLTNYQRRLSPIKKKKCVGVEYNIMNIILYNIII